MEDKGWDRVPLYALVGGELGAEVVDERLRIRQRHPRSSERHAVLPLIQRDALS